MKPILLCIFLFILPFTLSAKQKVLIIQSYNNEYSWDQSYLKGINAVLQDNFEISNFEMNTKNLPKSEHLERANKAWQYFQNVKPNLVILGDDNALNYLGERFSQTSTPVIYLGINNNPRHYNVHQSKNITGVLERPIIKRAIPLMVRLLPNKVSNVLLMFDNSWTSQVILKEVFHNKTQLTFSNINVNIKLINDWRIWKNELLAAKDNGYGAVFLGIYQDLKDSEGEIIPDNLVLKWSEKNTPIPPFGFWDFSIGQDKAIGGFVLFGYEQGRTAAEIAKEILSNNKKPYQVSLRIPENGHYLFSKAALDKYNIKLPPKVADKSILID